jgi:hypothetical protein
MESAWGDNTSVTVKELLPFPSSITERIAG